MRRPNRNVEVFDISLMAVVTKAMGAFLVLMLLLMPYYTGPVPVAAVTEMAKQLEEARKKLQEAMAAGDPAELRRLLEEARARIDEAERRLEELRRDNEALQAQVKRLEGELDEARADNEALKKKNTELSKSVISGQLINSDCRDVRLDAGVVTQNTYFESEGKQQHDFLGYTSTLGDSFTRTDDFVLSQFPDQAAVQPGHGFRFNHSFFRYALDDGTYHMIIVSRSKVQKTAGKLQFYPLKHPTSDCRLLLTMERYFPNLQQFEGIFVREFVLPKTSYATIAFSLEFGAKGVTFIETSPDAQKWFGDQIAHAEKEPDPPTLPFPPQPARADAPSDSAPISPAEAERRRLLVKQLEEMRRKSQPPAAEEQPKP